MGDSFNLAVLPTDRTEEDFPLETIRGNFAKERGVPWERPSTLERCHNYNAAGLIFHPRRELLTLKLGKERENVYQKSVYHREFTSWRGRRPTIHPRKRMSRQKKIFHEIPDNGCRSGTYRRRRG